MTTFPDDKKWDSGLDEKWRLSIPAAILKEFKTHVFVKQGRNGCLQILRYLPLSLKTPLSFELKLGIHEGKPRRITIPQVLRDSKSFYFGKKVTIAQRRDHLEIWPRYERLS